MSKLVRPVRGIWEFVVGEDWRTALGVVAAIALTALIATTTVVAWLVMPVAVLLLLTLSIWRSVRRALRRHEA